MEIDLQTVGGFLFVTAIVLGLSSSLMKRDQGGDPTPRALQIFGLALLIGLLGGLLLWVGQPEAESTAVDQERSDVRRTSLPDDPYEINRVAFLGFPAPEAQEHLFRAVLKNAGEPYSEDTVSRLSNSLVALRQASEVGVTEMDILKCMVDSGPVPDGVAIAEWTGLVAGLMELDSGRCDL